MLNCNVKPSLGTHGCFSIQRLQLTSTSYNRDSNIWKLYFKRSYYLQSSYCMRDWWGFIDYSDWSKQKINMQHFFLIQRWNQSPHLKWKKNKNKMNIGFGSCSRITIERQTGCSSTIQPQSLQLVVHWCGKTRQLPSDTREATHTQTYASTLKFILLFAMLLHSPQKKNKKKKKTLEGNVRLLSRWIPHRAVFVNRKRERKQ